MPCSRELHRLARAMRAAETVTDKQNSLKRTLSSRNATMDERIAKHIAAMRRLEAARAVTDEHCRAATTMSSRNVTDEKSSDNSTLSKRNGLVCARCDRKLDDGEMVTRLNLGRPLGACCWTPVSHKVSVMEIGSRSFSYTDSRWYFPPKPCEGCGRPVVYQANHRQRKHAFCCERCEGVYRWRLVKAQRSTPTCATCSQPFEPKRTDAKHCSPACKQKAYRKRREAV